MQVLMRDARLRASGLAAATPYETDIQGRGGTGTCMIETRSPKSVRGVAAKVV
jgi:hypothetical protein